MEVRAEEDRPLTGSKKPSYVTNCGLNVVNVFEGKGVTHLDRDE
jgi:hypothetical protein